ncbi:MAG: ATP-binding protein [Caldilineaceae bacterium]
MFVDRDRELAFLNEHYANDQAELVVLYGRRRVGKTELLRTFCADKPHLFFVADLGTEAGQLAVFTQQIGQFTAGDPDLLAPFPTWEAAFYYLTRQTQGRLLVVLDEFTYLIGGNTALPSILQKLWDTLLKDADLMLVLCGSYIGIMEQEVLAYRSPLYGRRTGSWRLQPLSFWDARLLLSGFSAVDQVRAYAALGGVPAYLRQVDDRLTLLENIERKVLSLGEFLYDEPRFLLLQELRDPSRYFAVLEAIAGGRTRLNEIAQAAHITPNSVSFYLKTLQEMGLIDRVVPVTETNPAKSRWGIYQLTDHYFRFWFRFVYPNHSLLERGETAQVRRRIAEQLDQFTGPAFERICQEWVWRHAADRFDLTPQAVGHWWNRQEEIDVAAVGEAGMLLGECKWTTRPVGVNIWEELQRKAQAVGVDGPVRYALFARAGFTEALTRRAGDEGVTLVGLEELVQG